MNIAKKYLFNCNQYLKYSILVNFPKIFIKINFTNNSAIS